MDNQRRLVGRQIFVNGKAEITTIGRVLARLCVERPLSVIVATVICLVFLRWAVIKALTNDTGFEDQDVWGVAQLLIVPGVLVVGGFLLERHLQRDNERRAKAEQEANEKQVKEEQSATRKRLEEERQAALLQKCFDTVFTLVSNKDPLIVVRFSAMTTFSDLSEARKPEVLRLLYESGYLQQRFVEAQSTEGPDSTRDGNDTYEKTYLSLLDEVDLSTIDYAGKTLIGANLSGAILTEANLAGVRLAGAKLIRANLKGAKLCGADLRGADLSWADVEDADFRGAILHYATLDNLENEDKAKWDGVRRRDEASERGDTDQPQSMFTGGSESVPTSEFESLDVDEAESVFDGIDVESKIRR